jgi:hypothetical protein
MRAGPLSNEKVIDLLNHYYIPVSVSHNEYVKKGSTVPPEERAEKQRIIREAWSDPRAPIIRAGEDATYLLGPDGHVVETLFPPTSIKTDPLIAFLERNIKKLNVPRGETLVPPSPPEVAPKVQPDELLLHLTARYIPASEGWGRIPAEDWIALRADQWKKLLAPADAQVGEQWPIDNDVATYLLKNFYPPTANTDLNRNVLEEVQFQGTVVSVQDGVARVRIDGKMIMKHPYFTTGRGPSNDVQEKDADYVVRANLIGYIDTDLKGHRIQSVRIVTDKGTYAKANFGAALRSVP